MSLDEDTRVGALDAVLDEQLREASGETVSTDLFAIVDVLNSSPTLRRALSDPGSPEDARRGLVHGLFDGKVSDAAVALVAAAAAARWAGGRTFAAAVERQAVRAELFKADSREQLEETEDELFRFARLVQGDPSLRNAVSDRSVPLAHRQTLIGDLLEGKVTESTITLAKRAVLAQERTFDHTLEGYIQLAAAQKNRLVATVRVAQPLTEDQTTRMQSALTRQMGRPVFVQVVVDPGVLGGVRVELGDEVIEGTVAGKLENARRLFS
jgi:F-type H+-transporting ATPase subunit delta